MGHQMRLIIIDDNMPNQVNGVVTTFNYLKNELFSRDNINVNHITPYQFYNIPAMVYPGARLPINLWKLENYIKSYNPTHLHICTEGLLGLTARSIFRKHGWNYTTSSHTRWDEYLAKTLKIKPNIGMKYMKWFHKYSYSVLVNTKSIATELELKGWKNLKIWTRGTDKDLFSFNDHTLTDKPTLLTVGRISKEKNIDAFCNLSKTNQYKLICVGDGPELNRLRKQYPDVIFLGELKGKELAEQYKMADCFVFTSITDTFGMVMIESMSTGTPIAAYPVQAPKDIIEQGITGFLHNDLNIAIDNCLSIPRKTVHDGSKKWCWKKTTDIFLNSLIEK
jgi:glycosyltransferase involved in cell wall biosynthesis